MKRLSRVGVAVALAAVSAVTFSQGAGGPPSPEAQAKAAIETRQGLFKVISSQFGPIGGMLRNPDSFNAELVAKNAARIQVLSEMIPELFARDTREFKDTKTRALDGIWASQADFKAKADALTKASAAAVAAAKTGDKAATMAAAADMGKLGCSPCHDNYRAK